MERKKRIKVLLVGGAVLAAAAVALVLWLRLGGQASGPVWIQAHWRPASPAEGLRRPVLWLNNEAFLAGAFFGGRSVLAGEMGLLVEEPGGRGYRRFTVADGLPVEKIAALAPLGDSLLLGLGLGGVARWDGSRVETLHAPALADDAVSSLAAAPDGAVLCATRKGRLLEIRPAGYRFVPTPGIPAASFSCALPLERGALVGTFQNGLYQGDGRRFQPILTRGRPFRMVTSLADLGGGEFLAGTDTGLAHFNARGDLLGAYFPDRIVEHVSVAGGLVVCACKEDAVYVAPLSAWQAGRRTFRGVRSPGFVAGSFPTPAGLVLLTSKGAYRLAEGAAPALHRLPTPAGELESSSVISLENSPVGGLVLGYFHGGVEERSPDGTGRQPIAMPEIFHANCLTARDGVLWIGTPQGLFRRTAAGIAPVGEPESPLLKASVNHVLPLEASLVAVSHSQGLTFMDGRTEYLLYARQGLPSNRILCTAGTAADLLAGSQAGLARLGAERVEAVYQTDTSPLRVNWITALLNTPRGTVVGTYGGGVQLLGKGNAWSEFEGADRRLYVNPNALCLAGEKVLVGTLNAGLAVLDLKTRKARDSALTLPSRCVQAILVKGNALYVGTDNGVAVFTDLRAILGTE